MNSPTVLHIVGSLEGGGAERWVRELVPRLNARGLHSEVVTVYPPRLDKAGLDELGGTVHHRAKRSGFDFAHFVWLRNLIADRKPTIVHSHQWAGKYVGRAAAVLAGTPLIVHTEHSPLPVSSKERIMALVLSFKTDAVISFDEHKAGLIRKRERVQTFEIIRNGIPISAIPTAEARRMARRKLAVADDTVIYGVVASLQERKNPRLALRAFASIAHDADTSTRLDFFGDGLLRDSLEAEARELGVSERVRFHGFRSDVRDFLPGLDVFMTLATQEMAPISMLEAMSARLPIIGAPHPGTIEMMVDGVNGAVVDWNVQEIAAAMRLARDDAEWRSRCGSAGRSLVERDYNIEDIGDQHVAFYERLIAHKAGRASGRSHSGTQVFSPRS